MKPPIFLTCILIFISTLTSLAQPPEQFTYQAVVRDSNNFIIRNTTIGLRLSVLKDSSNSTTPLYSEIHTLSTNGNGLITTEIGGGAVQSGDFSEIMWGDGIFFIKTEIDINGGTDYGISGVTQVLSVPYALYSRRSRYSDSSSVAFNAQQSSNSNYAKTSTYSDSARVTSFSQSSGTSSYSDSSRLSSYSNVSDTSGYSNYSDSSRSSGFIQTSRTSVYSDSSRASGRSDMSGSSVYSDSAGISGSSVYSDSSGISGYSDTSDFSNYSDSSVVSDFSDSTRIAGTSEASLFSNYADSSRISVYSDSTRVSLSSDTSEYSILSDSARAAGFSQSSLSATYSDSSRVSNSATYSDSARITSYSDSARASVHSDSSTYSDTTGYARVAQMLPRMTASQRDSMQNPPEGLQIYNLTTHCLELNMGPPTNPVWFQIGCLGTVDSLLCDSAIVSQGITINTQTEGRTITIPYSNGNSGDYSERVYQSEDISGLSLRLLKGRLEAGEGKLSMAFSGTPQDTGIAIFLIDVATKKCSLLVPILPYYPDGFVHCDPQNPTKIFEVLNPITNKKWMDRNLGASRAALFSSDEQAYGDFFQWGRFADGHQCRDSETTSSNATTAQPNAGNVWDGKFIVESNSPEDWLVPQEDGLWQGLNGLNNPCPGGYRIPTNSEWQTEINSWEDSSNKIIDAIKTPLRLPVSGVRTENDLFLHIGSYGFYWSSSVSSTISFANSQYLRFFSSDVDLISDNRAVGCSVRCIKD